MEELARFWDRGSIVLPLHHLHELVQDDELRNSPDAAAIYDILELKGLAAQHGLGERRTT